MHIFLFLPILEVKVFPFPWPLVLNILLLDPEGFLRSVPDMKFENLNQYYTSFFVPVMLG